MNYRKTYIIQEPNLFLKVLFMLGIEGIIKYSKNHSEPRDIELPPGVTIIHYNPALVRLTKERLREMIPMGIWKEYENITGIKLTEEKGLEGQLPEGVEIIPFNHKKVYRNSKNTDYQK